MQGKSGGIYMHLYMAPTVISAVQRLGSIGGMHVFFAWQMIKVMRNARSATRSSRMGNKAYQDIGLVKLPLLSQPDGWEHRPVCVCQQHLTHQLWARHKHERPGTTKALVDGPILLHGCPESCCCGRVVSLDMQI